jgi:hypothetical protein
MRKRPEVFVNPLLKQGLLLIILLLPVFFVYLFTASPVFNLVLILTILVMGWNIFFLLTKNVYLVIFYFLLFSLLTLNTGEFGVIGTEKVALYIVAAGIYVVVVLLLGNMSWSNRSFIGSLISLSAMPLVAAFILAPLLAREVPAALGNLILLTILTGVVTSGLVNLMWGRIKHKKPVLKVLIYFGGLR